ncbi:MAG: thioredoxin family protein [candidate division WOR-3 bacterium]|nr:MAG: thioredoxin family protein [candidate division WOR-3 bacterium]
MNDSGIPLVTENPLAKALRSKRPVLADFGRGTCIPCKMMMPILEKLQREYTSKVEILILDVGEYASLSRKYRVMMIPTQIFFDSSGKEVSRHQGFMAEDDIVAQLRLMGIE